LLCALLIPVSVALAAENAEPDIRAAAALLCNADTGEALYALNEHDRREPASLTKIMTALLVLEAVQRGEAGMDDILTTRASAFTDVGADGSVAGFTIGEEVRLEDLLYCIMLQSANEGCNILAVHISGSVAAFVSAMNARAAELGCAGTNFTNTHGMPGAAHYTTAADMKLIALAAMTTPHFMEIAHTDTYVVPATNKSASRKLTTTNSLISTSRYSEYIYTYARGIKTGHTAAAGYCLVSGAEKDGLRLLSVVLGAKLEGGKIRSFVETRELFEWGFSNFTVKKLLAKNKIVGQIPVIMGVGKDAVTLVPEEEVTALVSADLNVDDVHVELSLEHPEGIHAPVYKDQVLGTATVRYEDRDYGTVRVLASFSVERDEVANLWAQARDWLSRPWLRRLLIAVPSAVLLYAAFAVAVNLRRRAAKKKQTNYRGKKKYTDR
jgi:D-alanyl-D-alanine carboxypeptidase (penicillin-binding protein 5/6)